MSLHKTGTSLFLIRNFVAKINSSLKSASLQSIAKLVRLAGYSYKRCQKDTGLRNQ